MGTHFFHDSVALTGPASHRRGHRFESCAAHLPSFKNWRDSRGTRGNPSGGRGFWRFVRLHAAGCGRLRSRISRCNGCAFRVALRRAPLPVHRAVCLWRAAVDDVLKVMLAGHQVVHGGDLRRVPPPRGNNVGRIFLHPVRRARRPEILEEPRPGLVASPDDTNWTGAEIKSCCRLASLLDVPLVQAAQNVVPVAVTAGDKIEGLRQWASGRCLSADRAGVYSRSEVGGRRERRVVRAD